MAHQSVKSAGLFIAVTLLMALFASPTSAYVITSGSYNGTDVGALDTFLTSGSPNSSIANETIFVNNFLGTSFVAGTDATKFCDGNCGPLIYDTDGSNVFAIPFLPQTPAYFMIKTGSGSAIGPGHDHFLFENVNDIGFAVFQMAQMGFTGNDADNTGKISHMTIFGFGTTTAVPAPNMLVLMTLGLLMIGVGLRVRRRD